MDFNFIKIARSFIKKESNDEKDKANQFVRRLEDKFRELFVTKRDSKILDSMYITLFSVYDCMDIMKFSHKRVNLKSIIMSKIDVEPCLASNFKRNFDLFCEWQLDDIDWTNIIVCGGSVLASLMSSDDVTRKQYQMIYSDIDIEIFIYGLDEHDANEKLVEIYNAIRRRNPFDLLCVRTPDYISIVSGVPFRNIKIWLRLYKSPAEILMGIETDCCAVGFNGDKVFATPRWHYAMTTFTNTYDGRISSESYIVELLRWFKLGFSVNIPGLDTSMIDPRIYIKDIGGYYGVERLILALKTGSMNGQTALKQELCRLMMKPVSEIDVSVTPKSLYDASKIAELVYQRDAELNANRSDYPLHPCFVGSMDDVIHDCSTEPLLLESVPLDKQEDYIKNNVYGDIQWKIGLTCHKSITSIDVHVNEESLKPHRSICSHKNDNIAVTTLAKDIFGRSLIELAVLSNNANALKLIIEQEPDNSSIMKAICLAAEMGNLIMLQLMVNKGTNLTIDDSALVSSIIMGHFDNFEYLYNHPRVNQINGIFRLCWLYRRPQFIEYLVKTGLDCNEINNGERLLDEVIRYDDVSMVSIFIKCGHILDTDRSVFIAISRYLNSIGDEREIARSIIIYILSISRDLTINQAWKPLDLLIDNPDIWLIEHIYKISDRLFDFTFNRPNIIPMEFTLLDRVLSMLSDEKYKGDHTELDKIKNFLVTHKAKRTINVSDVEKPIDNRYKTLIMAVKKGDVKVVTAMISTDPSLAKPLKANKTPLYYACRNDDDVMFNALLASLDADEFKHIIDHRSIKCYKALFEAYEDIPYNIKRMIIDANTEFVKRGMVEFLDINFRHDFKYTIKDSKFSLKRNHTSKLITYIEMAAIYADPKSIVYMAKYAGESIDISNDKGETLMHQLMKSKIDSNNWVHSFHVITKLSMIEDLMNVKDDDGYTPINRYCIEERDSYPMIDIILNAGAKLDIPNNAGEYPIHALAKFGTPDAIDTVYRYDKCIIDSPTIGSKRTPLMISIIHGNNKVANLLIRLSCNLEIIDIYGNNALHYACMYSNITILNMLPNRVSIENCFGMTYIDYAINRAKMITSLMVIPLTTRRNSLLVLDAVKGRIKDPRSQVKLSNVTDMYEFILGKI